MKDTMGSSNVFILLLATSCIPHTISAVTSFDEQSTPPLLPLSSSSDPSISSSEDVESLPVVLKRGLPHEDAEHRHNQFHHPSADVIFVRKKPHVLKSSPPLYHHQHPAILPYVPSSVSPPCFHHHHVQPVEHPVSIGPIPAPTTHHHSFHRVEPAEVPASVRPVVPSSFEPPHSHLHPKIEPAEIPASVRPVTPSFESSHPQFTLKLEPTQAPSASIDPRSPTNDETAASPKLPESLPNDINVADIFGSTAAAAASESPLPWGDNAVTATQETPKPPTLAEGKPPVDHKPIEPKPHHSIIESIKEKIHHKKKEENPTAEPHHSIVETIKHKTEHLKEKIHHKKKEENPTAEPHHSIVESIKHKTEHLKEKIHHKKKEESIISTILHKKEHEDSHKENEGKEEKIPVAEKPIDAGSHHGEKVHGSVVSSLLHKFHHKREVSDHKKKGSPIAAISHKVEHLKAKIHHKKEGEHGKHHSIVSSILHKKEHLKGLVHHEHKRDEVKEVKIPAKEFHGGVHHELPHPLPKKPHGSIVSSLLHKIHHKRESPSVHKEEEEESLNFDVPRIGLHVPISKPSILHKLKSRKEHENEHKPHSLLRDLLHKA